MISNVLITKTKQRQEMMELGKTYSLNLTTFWFWDFIYVILLYLYINFFCLQNIHKMIEIELFIRQKRLCLFLSTLQSHKNVFKQHSDGKGAVFLSYTYLFVFFFSRLIRGHWIQNMYLNVLVTVFKNTFSCVFMVIINNMSVLRK